MDGLSLLLEGKAAGLTVLAAGDRLVIRGPKSANAVARRLLAHKTAVLAALPYADWVRRPDCHGRVGWEAPDLPEAVRWWARCDWDELPEQPARLRKQTLKREPVPQAYAGCVPAGLVEPLDLKSKRPAQGLLAGFGGV